MNLINNPTAAITAYCLSSILMTVTNKFVLSSYNFHMNFFLLGVQSTTTIVLLGLFRYFGLISHRTYHNEDVKKWFIVSIALVLMIYTGSKALQYLPIPLWTIFKNLTIIMIAYGEKNLLKGSPVTSLMMTSFMLMVLSSLMGAWADISTGNISKKPEVSYIVSYGWMAANCLSTAFFSLIMKAKIKETGFKEFDTVYYNNLLSIPVLFFLSLFTEVDEFWNTYDLYIDAPDYSFYFLIFSILFSGFSGFAISYGSSWCLRVTSSTTYSMVGALNKLPVSLFGMVIFSDPVTFGSIGGIFLAFAAGLVYNAAKERQKREMQTLPVHFVLPKEELNQVGSIKSN